MKNVRWPLLIDATFDVWCVLDIRIGASGTVKLLWDDIVKKKGDIGWKKEFKNSEKLEVNKIKMILGENEQF